jgi:hypothetical protein
MLPTETDRLLLCCLSAEPDASKAARLQGLSISDWEEVFSRSASCGVTPLLYQRLRSLQAFLSLPPEIEANLRMAYLASAARNTRLYHELGQVLGALQEERIPVMALKGVHLAQMVYGDVALRPMGDIDLLVRKSDLPRVEKRLLEMEYQISGVRDWWATYCHHLVFQRTGRGIPVEVHWTLMHPGSPFSLDVPGLWQRAWPATLAGVKVKVLSPADLLLYACLHTSFCDRFPGVKPLADILEIVRYYRHEIDWGQFVRRAHQWQAHRYIFLTLHIAGRLLAADVPDQVLARLRPDDFNPQVGRWAIEQTLAEKTNASEFSINFFELCRPGQPWRKVSLLIKAIFPPLEFLAHRYSLPVDSPRLRLYLLRLKELLQHYGWPALRRSVNDHEMVVIVRRENGLVDWLTRVASTSQQ